MPRLNALGKTLPLDLLVVGSITILLLGSIFTSNLIPENVRTILGFVFVLFVPGYAVVAALFPERSSEDSSTAVTSVAGSTTSVEVDGLERVALSVGLSLSIVPLVGIILDFTPWGIRLLPILSALTAFTLLTTAIAIYRRAALPLDRRFRLSRQWLERIDFRGEDTDSRRALVVNTVLILSIVLAASSVAFAVAFPGQEEEFTEFYILSENENGSLVAQNFPSTVANGSEETLHVGIGNREGERMEYVVVAKLQRTAIDANSTRVIEEQTVGEVTTAVGTNSSWVHEFSFRPTMTGEKLRLVFLLYRGEAPADPGMEDAYRTTHIWINVESSDTTEPLIMPDRVQQLDPRVNLDDGGGRTLESQS